jgi:hypothetical protein
MSEKRKIFIAIATKWSIRNLIVTKVLDQVAHKYDIVLFVNSTLLESEYVPLLKRFECIFVDPYPEKLSNRIFRQLKKAFIYKGANIHTERIWKKYVSRPIYQKIGDYFISVLLYFINFKWLFNQVDKLEWNFFKDQRFNSYFNQYSPKYLMVSLLNTPLDESLIGSAVETNTEIRYLLMSWDHLTTKVVLNNNFSLIYLWSKINQNEVLDLYQYYKKENLRVVGPPQFTIYNSPSSIKKQTFIEYLDISFSGNLFYYSAAPVVRHSSQDDIILELLHNWKFDKYPIHVLFKVHPLDTVETFKKLSNHPNITLIDNLTHNKIKNFIPTYDEILFNRDLLFHSNININIYSSVTLEAFLLNKPVIHIAYQKNWAKNTIPCNEYYNFSHFEVITKSEASSIVHSLDQFIYCLEMCLNNQNYNRKKRLQFNNHFWGDISNDYTKNLINEMIS